MGRHTSEDGCDREASHDRGSLCHLRDAWKLLIFQEVDESMTPKGFKLPTMEWYDGAVDPINHLETFCTSLSIQGVNDAIMCKAFPTTLKNATRSWFFSLPPNQLAPSRTWDKSSWPLYQQHRSHENIHHTNVYKTKTRQTTKRVHDKIQQRNAIIKDFDHTVIIVALTNGLRDKDFIKSLT